MCQKQTVEICSKTIENYLGLITAERKRRWKRWWNDVFV